MQSPLGREPSTAPQASSRLHTLIVLLGAPGAGKSSWCDEQAKLYRQGARQVLIVDPNGNWPGVGWWPKDGDVDTWIDALRDARKGAKARGVELPPLLIILDDADLYLPKTPPRNSGWRDLFTSFRHWQCDVIVNARRSQDLPLLLFTAAKYLVVFTTREVRSREYLRDYVGEDAVSRIPSEPHRYVLIDVDAHDDAKRYTEGRTKRRA